MLAWRDLKRETDGATPRSAAERFPVGDRYSNSAPRRFNVVASAPEPRTHVGRPKPSCPSVGRGVLETVSSAIRTVAEHFNADQDSPLRRAELLNEAVADSQFESQVLSIAGPFQTPGQETFEACLVPDGLVHSRFSEDFGSGNDDPSLASPQPAARADTKQEFIPIGTARR